MKKLVAGYSAFGAPSANNGLGPFKALFSEGVNLNKAKNLDGVDALILWGGEDISPSLYKEPAYQNSGPTRPSTRDVFEWELIKEAVKRNIPIIGVCRGAQLACAYAGGKLIQHVTGHNNGWHSIQTYDNRTLQCTTAHHQMLYVEDIPHELLAWASYRQSVAYQPTTAEYCRNMSNTISIKEPEVVLLTDINCLAVQGHPEWHGEKDVFNEWFFEQFEFFCLNQVKC